MVAGGGLSMTSPDSTCRIAEASDLPGVAEVFAAAFPESVRHVSGSVPEAAVLADLFALARSAEPGSLLVAEAEGRVAGYVLAPAHTGRLQRAIFWRGSWLRLAGHWLAGRYGPRWRVLRLTLAGKLAFLRFSRRFEACEARILSLAVHPDFQGRGLGRRLLEAGLAHLRAEGAPCVRLEVRPDNAPARCLYEQHGFQALGTYEDPQGPWLVMLQRGEDSPHAPPAS